MKTSEQLMRQAAEQAAMAQDVVTRNATTPAILGLSASMAANAARAQIAAGLFAIAEAMAARADGDTILPDVAPWSPPPRPKRSAP